MPRVKSKGRLTAKQRRFVAEYLVDLNATQAAIRSGYSHKTAEQQGYRLLRNVQIGAAVDKGQREARQRCEVTRDSIARQLDADHALAHAAKQAGAAVAATVAKAKLFGLLKDTVEHSGRMTLEQLVAQIPERARTPAPAAVA